MRRFASVLSMLAPLAAGAFSGCASTPGQAMEMRIQIQLQQPSADTVAIERRASRAAGQPVRYAAGVSEQSHALIVTCPDEHACQAALQGLRADTAFAARVDLDQRQRARAP